MKQTALILALFLGLAAPLAAAAAAPAAAAANAYDLSGKFGVGGTWIPSRNGDLTALSGTYWTGENFALEGQLGYGSGSYSYGGTDSAGKAANDSLSRLGVALAGRYNAAKPATDAWFQLVGRLSYASASTGHPVLGTTYTNNTSAIGLYLGLGFEAFMPYWRSITLEANTGLNYDMYSTSSSGGSGPASPAVSESNMWLGNSTGGLPMNIALHYYFR